MQLHGMYQSSTEGEEFVSRMALKGNKEKQQDDSAGLQIPPASSKN